MFLKGRRHIDVTKNRGDERVVFKRFEKLPESFQEGGMMTRFREEPVEHIIPVKSVDNNWTNYCEVKIPHIANKPIDLGDPLADLKTAGKQTTDQLINAFYLRGYLIPKHIINRKMREEYIRIHGNLFKRYL